MVRPTAKCTSVPAPVSGLNDRDSIADMPKKDAVLLENWWPYPSYVSIRKGAVTYAAGLPGVVKTLAEYSPTSGNDKIFAASGNGIYDVTNTGTVGEPVVTGISNALFQWQGLTTPGGSFLYMINGQDSPQLYDGSTWKSITNVSTPSITGVEPSTFAHVTLFKNRLFFVQANSMNIWYLPVNSVGGAAQVIDLGSVFRRGGYVMAVYTWTIDAGSGSDDHLVIISSNGEVAVYRGSDPSSASDWSIVGVFFLGMPLGRRCGTKLGGDLAINTVEGVLPLSRSLLSMSINREAAITDKIQNSVSQMTASYGGNEGWQVEIFPQANMLILNVPAGNGRNFQYCQNTITGAWAKFTGWNASSWLNTDNGLFYGGDGKVFKAWVGSNDDSLGIVADMLCAFSEFGMLARNKFYTMIRPNILTNGTPSIVYSLNTDYNIHDPTGTLSYEPPTGMFWGSMIWGDMVWGGSLVPLSAWQTVGAVSKSAAMRLRVNNSGSDVRLTNVDYVYQVGGIL